MKRLTKKYSLNDSLLYKRNLKIHSKLWIPYTVSLLVGVLYVIVKEGAYLG